MPINKNAYLRYRIIDNCLRSNHYPRIEKIQSALAIHFDSVSESTISKDIADMKLHFDAPIKYHRGKMGYYYEDANFSLNDSGLTTEEYQALDYSMALLQQVKNSPLFHTVENAINKITEGYLLSRHHAVAQAEILQIEEPTAPNNTPWMNELMEAISKEQAIQIHYRKYSGEDSLHTFSPYLLKEYRNRWYAIGFSSKRKMVVVLALDRMQSVSASKATYQKSDFNAKAYFQYTMGVTVPADSEPITVQFRMTAAAAPYIDSMPLHLSQQLLQTTETHADYSITVYKTPELFISLLSFGADLEVLAPADLRAEMKQKAADMLAVYQNSEWPTK